jgi:hypothetical protein
MPTFNEAPGLEWFKLYEATVIDNNDTNSSDGRQLCRIKARVATIMDQITDEFLPWAIPFTDYSIGESNEQGKGDIPIIGAKVLIAFQGGSLNHPVYMGYCVDEKTQLFEMLYNYPNRSVFLRKNHFLMILDAVTNEMMIRQVGDLHLYVTGSVDLTVAGDLTEKVMGNRTLYVDGDNTEVVRGNSTKYVGKDLSETIKANSNSLVGGSQSEVITKDSTLTIGGGRDEGVVGNRTLRVDGDNTEMINGVNHETPSI